MREVLANSYLEIYKKDNYQKIVKLRAKSNTLEKTGQMIGVTRERIRQIEKRIQHYFDTRNNKTHFIWIISAFLGGKTVISKKEIDECLGDEFEGMSYLLAKSNSVQYTYFEEEDSFIVGKCVDVGAFKKIADSLPDIVFAENMDNIRSNILEEFQITYEEINKIIVAEYKLFGRVYCKRKITLTEMCGMVLQRYYPAGVKLFDELEQIRFRRYIFEMFGDVKLPENGRSLDARVADAGVLCDRGTYIHHSYIEISDELLTKIKNYIEESERNSCAFLDIFEQFKEKLLCYSNVNNRYFLQGTLKYYFKKDYFYSKDMISKSCIIENIDFQITEYIGNHDSINKEQLRAEFSGITEAMLFFALGRCSHIIMSGNGVYMHEKHLDIKAEDYEICNLIDGLILENPVSSRKLLEVMYTTHTDFLNRNSVFSHIKLFSILKNMFMEKYKFSRPFIAKCETEDMTNIGVVKNFLKGKEFYEISELVGICEENHIKFLSLSALVDDLSDEFLRVDSNLCVNIEQIDIDEEKIEMIRSILLDMTKRTGYISARKINNFIFFPEIGIEWTGYALKSITEMYISDVEVLLIPTSDTFLLSAIFLNESCYYNNYEDFLRSALKLEQCNSPFKNLNDVKKWLKEEELINQSIPKFMTDKRYLRVDELGNIIIE